MSDNTKIEWTDATVNAVNGCSVISPGCKHCYAMKQAHRFPVRQGLTQKTSGGMVWTGEVRLNESALLQPLAWKRPRNIFWNAHGDLFHENVPDNWINRVLAVTILTPQHVHQILTKRSSRMRDHMSRFEDRPDEFGRALADVVRAAGLPKQTGFDAIDGMSFPLLNVWLGVSVEDQQRADERIPDLLATPAAVRFLSCEPLLGQVDLSSFMNAAPGNVGTQGDAPGSDDCSAVTSGQAGTEDVVACSVPRIDWVIVGGESGPGARPMHPDWARGLRDQCAAAGVPFFMKQWGDWLPWEAGCPPEWQSQNGQREDHHALLPDDIDADPRWDDGLWAVPEHDHFAFQRVGKKAAGRLLDGVQHDGMPR